MQLQKSGIRAEDVDVQRFLAGVSPFRGKIATVAYDIADEAMDKERRFDLMAQWEEENPGKSAYPPLFAEVILAELRGINTSDPLPTIEKLIKLAEDELVL